MPQVNFIYCTAFGVEAVAYYWPSWVNLKEVGRLLGMLFGFILIGFTFN